MTKIAYKNRIDKGTNAKYSKGMLLYKKKQYKNALYYLLDYFKDTQDERTGITIANCYFEIGKKEKNIDKKRLSFNQAERVIKYILEDKPDLPKAYFILGRIYFEQRDYKKSDEMFEKALMINKKDYYLAFELSKIYLEQGQTNKAIKILKNIIDDNDKKISNKKNVSENVKKTSVRAHFELGKIYSQKRNYSEAETEYKKCLETNENDSYAHFYLGLLYAEQGRYPSAEEEFYICSKLEPNNRYINLQKGRIYREQGKFKPAKKELNYCLQEGLDNYETHFQLGMLYKEQKKYKKAEEELGICLEFNEKDYDAHLQLGIIYREQGMYELSEIELKNCLSLNKKRKDSKIHLHIGLLYRLQKRYQKAESELNKCLKIDIENPYVELLLKNIQALIKHDYDAADKYLKIANEIGLNDSKVEGYNNLNRLKHIRKHFNDDKSKSKHGVFKHNIIDIFNHAKECISEGKYNLYRMNSTDIYLIKMRKCGYCGGKNGDGHSLNYMEVVTYEGTDEIITIFPSEGPEEIKSTQFEQVIKAENLRSMINEKEIEIEIDPQIISNIAKRINAFIKLENLNNKVV